MKNKLFSIFFHCQHLTNLLLMIFNKIIIFQLHREKNISYNTHNLSIHLLKKIYKYSYLGSVVQNKNNCFIFLINSFFTLFSCSISNKLFSHFVNLIFTLPIYYNQSVKTYKNFN